MSGFEWGRNIGRARLATGKATQLYNDCQELKDILDQRRVWARCIRAQYPAMSALLAPEIPDSHCFTKFKRTFSFDYCDESDTWVLSFVEPAPPAAPNTGDNAARPGEPGGAGGNGGGAPPAGAAMQVLNEVHAAARRLILRALYAMGLWADFGVDEACAKLETARAQLSQARCYLSYRYQRMERELRRRLSLHRDNTFEPESFAHAHLEPRFISVAGMGMVLHTFAPEKPRWDDWLFGRLEDERVLIDCSV